jgi:hypothetical protein
MSGMPDRYGLSEKWHIETPGAGGDQVDADLAVTWKSAVGCR